MIAFLVSDALILGSFGLVYLSGPMTGLPEWNFPAFDDAAKRLRAGGLAVLSPAEKDLEGGFDPASDGEGFDLRAALEWDVAAVLAADAVVVLPGWEDSAGCVVEVLTAEALGKPVVALDTMLATLRLAAVA